MPASQDDPPQLDGAAPPQFYRWSQKLYDYLRAQRIVQGLYVDITDADGGGKLVSAQPGGNNLPLFAVDIVAVGIAREGVLIPMKIPALEEP